MKTYAEVSNMYETIKVRTHQRLYRGAKLDIGGVIRRVVHEGPSICQDGFTITLVQVEPTLVNVGDWTIDAVLVADR